MPETPSRFAVTGAAGFLGQALVSHLIALPSTELVVAIDVRARPGLGLPPARVTWVTQDVRQPMSDVFRNAGVQAIAHLAYVVRPSRAHATARAINVGGTESVLAAARACRAGRVVYPSSTTVYGAHADYRRPYVESDPVRPLPGFQYSVDKVEAEILLRRFSDETEVPVAILRCPPVMGESSDNFIVRSLTRRILPVPFGASVEFQFLHISDLVVALVTSLNSDAGGTFNVTPEGTVRWRDMVRSFGNRTIPVPGPLLKAVVGATWAAGLQSESPPSGVDFIRYPWLADGGRFKTATGWRARYDSAQALGSARGAIGVPQ